MVNVGEKDGRKFSGKFHGLFFQNGVISRLYKWRAENTDYTEGAPIAQKGN